MHADVAACKVHHQSSAESDGTAGAGFLRSQTILHDADGTCYKHQNHHDGTKDSGSAHDVLNDDFGIANGIDNSRHNETS